MLICINNELNKIIFLGEAKTIILNITELIEDYQKGSMYYDGQVIKKEKDIRLMHKEKIGFILQDFGLIENMTVKENLNIVQKIRVMKNKNEVMNDTLKDLNLECVLDKKVFELSGGEQQRVAIAKLLLKDPDLILADEPTASLDENNQQLILNLMRQICEQGKTIIFVSHDAATREFADIKIDLTKEKENRK